MRWAIGMAAKIRLAMRPNIQARCERALRELSLTNPVQERVARRMAAQMMARDGGELLSEVEMAVCLAAYWCECQEELAKQPIT
jgi:hypothetical protein